jgi:kanamycin kinase
MISTPTSSAAPSPRSLGETPSHVPWGRPPQGPSKRNDGQVLLAGPPSDDVQVPAAIRRLSGGQRLAPVWQNLLGGLTFQLDVGPHRRFAKWAPAGSGLDLAAEVVRLRWAVAFTPVPQVIDHGSDREGTWTLLTGLPGDNAVSDRWKRHPEIAVRATGQGLRALHDRLPVDRCPFSWSVSDRLGAAGVTPRHLPAGLGEPPPIDKLVVCHGDPCVPNTMIDSDGKWSGHVDLSVLGTADRWADIAVATWSTEWNYGPGWEPTFLDAYGVEADTARTAFYRDLWDLDWTPSDTDPDSQSGKDPSAAG